MTDGNGCTVSATGVVPNAPSGLSAGIEQAVAYNGFGVSCNGAADGVLNGLGTGGTPPYTWLWNNGSNEQHLNNSFAGNYLLTLTDAKGCTATATFTLTQPPVFVVGATPHSSVCENKGSIAITVAGITNPYVFSLDGAPFQSDPVFQNVASGGHEVVTQDINGCEVAVDVILADPPTLSLILLPGDTTILLGDGLQLDFQANFSPDSLAWTPASYLSCIDCPDPVATPLQSQVYSLTAFSADGCAVTDELMLSVYKERRVFIPNTFSPNDDGVNDFFNLYGGKGTSRVLSAHVFDRWGGHIFIQKNPPLNDPGAGWDGTWKGKKVEEGVYIYFFEVEFEDGTTEIFKGDVTVVR